MNGLADASPVAPLASSLRRRGPYTSENKLVIQRDSPPCKVAGQMVDFYGQVGAAWIVAAISELLVKEEFWPRPRERGLGGVLG